MNKDRIEKINKIFNSVTNSHQIHEAILFIESSSSDFSYNNGYGGKELNSPLLMASVTKLFTTTCVIALQEQGLLSLNDKITKYFDNTILDRLHTYKGKDYSHELAVSDLLFQISGLPDIFEEGTSSSKNNAIKSDSYVTFDEVIDWTKQHESHFAPRTKNKSYYANINFDMLGKIIEKVTKLSLEEAYKRFIFEPLGLKKTYLPIDENDFIPNIYYKNESIYRPKTIMCSRASGGCITTARELMIFIKAFFGGTLFNTDIFKKLSIYNKLVAPKGPLYYGGGYMQIPLEGITSLFMGKGALIGHSGSTGSFAFYYPYKDLFIVGDINQMSNPAIPIRLIMKLAMLI